MSAMARSAPTTFYREMDRNRRRSWLLVVVVVLVLAALGGAIGYATGLGWGGVLVALIVAAVMSVGSFFAGDALVMATSGARELSRAEPPCHRPGSGSSTIRRRTPSPQAATLVTPASRSPRGFSRSWTASSSRASSATR
jgi:heat shock protein HtpX